MRYLQCLLIVLLMCVGCNAVGAVGVKPVLPPNAVALVPVLTDEIKTYWPDLILYSTLGAQVEQESCVSLKSKRCWSPYAELRTDREYGFGLGQITITKRFNVFEEVKSSDRSLRNWSWEDRFDPRMQLRAIVIKMRNTFKSTNRLSPDPMVRLAMTASSYNGGLGSVLKDRVLCSNTPGCDPTRWFGHIELTSFKSRTAVKGYGKSFYAINREYVHNLLDDRPRRFRYAPYMDARP